MVSTVRSDASASQKRNLCVLLLLCYSYRKLCGTGQGLFCRTKYKAPQTRMTKKKRTRYVHKIVYGTTTKPS